MRTLLMEIVERVTLFVSETLQNVSNISKEVTVVSLILCYILASVVYFVIRDYGVPPGPIGVPILGWWPYIDSARSHLQQVELKKKYGDIFSFRITGTLYINLASMKILKEAHITKTEFFREMSQRTNLLRIVFGDGIVFLRGENWQTVRKYFLAQFRERGMTLFKENTADAAHEAVKSLVDDLRKLSNEPFDILNVLVTKSNQMIRNTLFGLDTPVTEEEINSIQEEYRQVGELIHAKNMLLIGNFARYCILPRMPFFKEGVEIHTNIRRRFQKMIDEHKRSFDGDNIRDIIDSFIQERNMRKSKGDETYKHFTDETLLYNLLQFVGDGVVNVATFVTTFIMALLDHPEEEDKIYQELVEVCGEDRDATMADKSKLRYFNAFLFEAQRTANFVPLFPSLECTKETTVGGYRIPQGAVTVTNVYAIHNDPNVYENPETFNPSRFLGVDGKQREELPITFGVGKRVCLGENFALMQAFLYLAAIVKNFKISYEVPKTQFEMLVQRTLKVLVTPRKHV